jgi:hypothetical protein
MPVQTGLGWIMARVQCGYCTPGLVVALTRRPVERPGEKLTEAASRQPLPLHRLWRHPARLRIAGDAISARPSAHAWMRLVGLRPDSSRRWSMAAAAHLPPLAGQSRICSNSRWAMPIAGR